MITDFDSMSIDEIRNSVILAKEVLRSLSAASGSVPFSRAYVALSDCMEDLNFLQRLIDREPDLSVQRACEILGAADQASQDFFTFEPIMSLPDFESDCVRPKK